MSEFYIFKFIIDDDEFIEAKNITMYFGNTTRDPREEYEEHVSHYQGNLASYYKGGGKGKLSYAAWFDGELV